MTRFIDASKLHTFQTIGGKIYGLRQTYGKKESAKQVAKQLGMKKYKILPLKHKFLTGFKSGKPTYRTHYGYGLYEARK
jgi:hypothetical protein